MLNLLASRLLPALMLLLAGAAPLHADPAASVAVALDLLASLEITRTIDDRPLAEVAAVEETPEGVLVHVPRPRAPALHGDYRPSWLDVLVRGAPPAGDALRYDLTLRHPSRVPLVDGKGTTIGEISVREQRFRGTWAPELRTFVAAEVELRGLAGFIRPIGLALRIDELGWSMAGTEQDGWWTGTLSSRVAGLAARFPDDDIDLSELRQQWRFTNLSMPDFGSFLWWPGAIVEGDATKRGANADRLRAIGTEARLIDGFEAHVEAKGFRSGNDKDARIGFDTLKLDLSFGKRPQTMAGLTAAIALAGVYGPPFANGVTLPERAALSLRVDDIPRASLWRLFVAAIGAGVTSPGEALALIGSERKAFAGVRSSVAVNAATSGGPYDAKLGGYLTFGPGNALGFEAAGLLTLGGLDEAMMALRARERGPRYSDAIMMLTFLKGIGAARSVGDRAVYDFTLAVTPSGGFMVNGEPFEKLVPPVP